MSGGGLRTSSSARPSRQPTTVGIDSSNQIPPDEPHVKLGDPEEVNPQVEQHTKLMDNLQQQFRESLDKQQE
uniref:Uncharacterized protein n=1 Tax=Cannabis sativa TaxID=3483 RepID=A0A803QDQ4_CANSA